MRSGCFIGPVGLVGLAVVAAAGSLAANEELLRGHCFDCHNDKKAKGKFNLKFLGEGPSDENLEHWLGVLDLVEAEDMPPEDESELSQADREKLVAWVEGRLEGFEAESQPDRQPTQRRLNNREFANSVRDVLLIEDIGTHLPTDNLIGDSLHKGFDTHGETLGFSKFHLEQFLEAARRIVDATIISGSRPESRRVEVGSGDITSQHTSQNTTRPERRGNAEGFDFLDPKQLAYFDDFKVVPATGRYKITIRATGKDRGKYSADDTGVYHADPIKLVARMGGRERVFDLPDEKVMEIELDEWLAAGTRFRLHYPTDGLKMRGNGNFKFQYAIGGFYLKKHNPELWQEVASGPKAAKRSGQRRNADSWHNWTDYWQGARPRIFSAVVEGPSYESWPPVRQVRLIGKDPKVEDAAKILAPLAERAWRRPVKDGELDKIVALVEARAKSLGTIEAFKEGVVAILVSPAILLLNAEDLDANERYAAKIATFLHSSTPGRELREAAAKGDLGSYDDVRALVSKRLAEPAAGEFLREFPFGWLELNDINFMAPDPDRYRFYHRKDLSDDMVGEVLHFFRHAVANNLPLPELLSADYSFLNADLAAIYGVDGVPQDSVLRRYTFTDGRRGGLLGMGAFLTSTADSNGTSPIHRAVYVMENFLGIHPTPPPPDVEIKEPDVRQAKTIKQVLAAHVSDENCAGCHKTIDPWGYAFENFDPTGAWRDSYQVPVPVSTSDRDRDIPRSKLFKDVTIPVDASAKFRNGKSYRDVVGFRKQLLTKVNRDRLVRCFVTKLLTYANGVEPTEADFVEIGRIIKVSAKHDYRIVDTIAAVVHSPLFREY